MNKQELIDKYTAEIAKLRPYCPNRNLISEQLKYDLYKEILDDLEQLDEPQKPVVPKFVAEWFEDNKDDLDNAIFGYLVFWEERDTDSVLYQWFAKSENNPIETLIRMKDGYEVEKEPLYTVELPSMTPSKLVFDEDYCKYKIVGDYTVGRLRHHLTEKEIKYFDERYWAFAVPVEEVVE
ncbi:DUF1642 domain-containing protein [Enterococcus faecium]|uniref:DUF1642 domain-containing protein n=1 Tax=Enterococcus faecium TaxID=1352 RepID=UPI000F5050A2|nr:DUF1642 domain-containing protein [Enterococcus faecium]MBD9758304.1 DUF1642 domain-containing protein [Enterococcus faecium]ROY77233.1 DUF1642 domain-containing protein [Enterococcus faecium]ROY77315.1 DUF1642 domain-containing protein [Enterococcus faecium]ROY79201.1 DUF1642 domain-containing protein [Enterococcus faecium]ROY87728.1 DUF1642 domain-containing protein [Enterococcus faecium]